MAEGILFDAALPLLLPVTGMKRWQFTLLLVIGIASLLLGMVVIVFARENRRLQVDMQAQQAIINKGALSQQIGTNLLREMAIVAQNDQAIRELLQANGYNLAPAPSPAPSP